MKAGSLINHFGTLSLKKWVFYVQLVMNESTISYFPKCIPKHWVPDGLFTYYAETTWPCMYRVPHKSDQLETSELTNRWSLENYTHRSTLKSK